MGDGRHILPDAERLVRPGRVQQVLPYRNQANGCRAQHKQAAHRQPLPGRQRHGQGKSQRHRQPRQVAEQFVPPDRPRAGIEATNKQKSDDGGRPHGCSIAIIPGQVAAQPGVGQHRQHAHHRPQRHQRPRRQQPHYSRHTGQP